MGRKGLNITRVYEFDLQTSGMFDWDVATNELQKHFSRDQIIEMDKGLFIMKKVKRRLTAFCFRGYREEAAVDFVRWRRDRISLI